MHWAHRCTPLRTTAHLTPTTGGTRLGYQGSGGRHDTGCRSWTVLRECAQSADTAHKKSSSNCSHHKTHTPPSSQHPPPAQTGLHTATYKYTVTQQRLPTQPEGRHCARGNPPATHGPNLRTMQLLVLKPSCRDVIDGFGAQKQTKPGTGGGWWRLVQVRGYGGSGLTHSS